MPTSIKNLYLRAIQLCNRLGWLGPLIIRLVVGTAFVLTGWGKLHNLEDVTKFFESLHIPLAGPQAAFIATLEFAGGLLLIAGLGTRIIALLLSCTMIVALATAILPKAESLAEIPSSIELTYLAIFAWLIVHGAGSVSLDRVIARRGSVDHQVGEAA
jgi:putative oxidoreductase